MIEDDEILKEFVIESTEHLADVEGQLLEIEACGADINLDLVNTVFRAVHSVKGAAGFLGLSTINALAHNLENVLNQIRNCELTPTAGIVDTLLRSADLLRTLVADVAHSNQVDVSAQVAELKKILEEEPTASAEQQADLAVAEALADVVSVVRDASREIEPTPVAPTPVTQTVSSAPAPPARTDAVKPGSASPVTVSQDAASADKKSTTKHVESNVRVNVSVLDRLMNLAGELVLGRNQLLQTVNSKQQDHLEAIASRLDHVTSELQEAIMQTRMQPVGTVFNRFPRVVRDLSSKLSKKCELEIEGSEVEVDKTIIEAIGDPLTHLVRNSVDHGIELPHVRKAAGKPEHGTIRMRAFHRAGKVCVRIEDDGHGIDPARVKAKALQNGLITESDALTMSHADVLRLIFAPGFSTAAAVTDVSGRGVGMDVVRTNIEQIGGTVDVESELGQGSCINITLPLTLAIIPSMIVGCGSHKFALPQTNIAELVRVPEREMHERIGKVHGAEVLRLRGSLLPLIRLEQVLGLPQDQSDLSQQGLSIIVVESGQCRYGIAVDALYDNEEIVVKPLGRMLKDLSYLAGATILGDGRVALILDITGIALKANIRNTEHAASVDTSVTGGLGEQHRLLLFDNSPNEHFAVPLACVSRIERVNVEQISNVGGHAMLAYGGGMLPLLAIENYINTAPREFDLRFVSVVVFSAGKREIGLIAPQLKDICDIALDVDAGTVREPGVPGIIVHEQRPIRLLDMLELAQKFHPDWIFEETQPTETTSDRRVLLAEDSAFFRRHVEETLVEAGYTVTTAVDGRDAWEQLQQMDPLPGIVVTDVEMPNMNGLEFCQTIRGSARTKDLPVIALTSLASPEDVQRGKQVGVDEYHIKLDRASLLESIGRLCQAR